MLKLVAAASPPALMMRTQLASEGSSTAVPFRLNWNRLPWANADIVRAARNALIRLESLGIGTTTIVVDHTAPSTLYDVRPSKLNTIGNFCPCDSDQLGWMKASAQLKFGRARTPKLMPL